MLLVGRISARINRRFISSDDRANTAGIHFSGYYGEKIRNAYSSM
jgi:hypothetical protein